MYTIIKGIQARNKLFSVQVLIIDSLGTIVIDLPLNWTPIVLVLESQRNDDKYKVEEEHGDTHALGHYPVTD